MAQLSNIIVSSALITFFQLAEFRQVEMLIALVKYMLNTVYVRDMLMYPKNSSNQA